MTQTIVVFGATSGIAKEYCRLKATPKSCFVLVARNAEALEDLKKDLIARQAQDVQTEVYDFENIENLKDLTSKVIHAEVDVALLAFGTLPDEKKCRNDSEYLRKFNQVNITATITLSNLIAEKMRAQSKGTIAVITSVAGDRGKQSNYHYGAAKSAVSTYLQGLRQDLSKHNVHVLDIKAGFVETPMTVHFQKGLLWAKPQSVARGIDRAIQSQKNVVYLPFFWRYIMLIICSIPEFIFKKMKL